MINMMQGDCMELMARTPDKYYELAIVDPPYGIGEGAKKALARARSTPKWKNAKAVIYTGGEWDSCRPPAEYFQELFRVSKNQIIWGANYYPEYLSGSMGWIAWYKKRQNPNSDFSDCEFAFTSFQKASAFFDFPWVGFGAVNAKELRIHPTQKPVALYKWSLSRYAKPGDKILDTHGGSGSICIACHDLGFDLDWIELDSDYYQAAVKRYKEHAAQGQLFDPKELRRIDTQPSLL
jgi:site-specific DNA-methyltransferase (adenine-specific)